MGNFEDGKEVNALRQGLAKGDLFEDGGFIYKIKSVNENGTYNSERVDIENTVFKEESAEQELVLDTETQKQEILPDASKDLQPENVNQEPEQLKQTENLEELSFKELKEKAVSLGFHFKVGQGKEQLIEFIKSAQE